MSNHKRKKPKAKKDGWTSMGRLYSRNRDAQTGLLPEQPPHRRTKTKSIPIMAKRKPNAPKWFHKDDGGWRVWSRYEKMRDAENALKAMQKGWPSKYHELRIGEQHE